MWASQKASGGGGGVSSVNTKTGVVVLDAMDVGAVDAFTRPAVTYVDDTGSRTFGTGTIDVSDGIWGGAAQINVGDTFLALNTNTAPEDSGVWVVTAVDTEAGTADVVLRGDCAPDQLFTAGEEIWVMYEEVAYTLMEISPASNVYLPSGYIDGDNYLMWGPSTPSNLSNKTLSDATLVQLTKVDSTLLNQAERKTTSGVLGVDLHTGVVFADATAGNITVQLASAANSSHANPAFGTPYSQAVAVKRTDSSGNTVTVALSISGEKLEGTTDGTVVLGAKEGKTFYSDGLGGWWVA